MTRNYLKLWCCLLLTLRLPAVSRGASPEVEKEYHTVEHALRQGEYEAAYRSIYHIVKLEEKEPGHRFNMACVQALWGKPVEALNSLRWAAHLGYANVESLDKDRDLQSVRGLPELAQIRAQIVANGTPATTEAAPAASAGTGEEVPAATFRGGVPRGLFIAQRYEIVMRNLETKACYFAPDGRIYDAVREGVTAADLQRHEGRKGTYTATGDQMVIGWDDGKTSEGAIEEATESGFTWDGWIMVKVEPFTKGRSIAANYSGGISANGFSGSARVGRDLGLRADGTYSLQGASSITSVDSTSGLRVGGTSTADGTWELNNYSLTLRAKDGKTTRSICFPFDAPETPVYPDRLFVGGMMFKHE